MRKNLTKIIIIVASVLLSIYFLYPTYKDSKYTRELRGLRGEDSLKYVEQHENAIHDAKMKRLKLGLDLQGGMRVVLEVDVLKMLEATAKNRDDNFNSILADVRKEAATSEVPLLDILRRRFQEKGIRLSRYYGNIRDTDDDIISNLEKVSTEAIDRGMEIIRNRVDQYGVSEPTIQKLGGRRIIVELPGVSKESEVRQLLQGTALLEFKLLKDPEVSYKIMDTIDKYLAGKGITDTTTGDTSKTKPSPAEAKKDTAATATTEPESLNAQLPKSEAEQAKEHPFLFLARPDQRGGGEAYVAEEDRDKVTRILNREDVKRLIPSDVEFLWSAKQAFVSEGKRYYTLLTLKKEPELTGGVITTARATIDPNTNQPIVTMEMNSEGSRDWARITGANVNKRIAIVLDKAVFSSPVVRNKITGGNSQIEGMANIDEARLLEIVLKAGALPAPVDIIEQRNVGPSLGEDSISKGLLSSVLAFAVIVLFMVVYYRTGGLMADIALLFNILFILGVLAGFQATLTLPGIAGIILTIGMAVDANVLIYERIREEAVTGKTLRAAIDAGYAKAFHAIFDSNITTFFSGVILYQFGTGPVQGFALTLMIGIAASMFSAIVITRVIFEVMMERGTIAINFG
ncbi:MAG: protein translocase subunit SecD [Bacteroidota bacterium]